MTLGNATPHGLIVEIRLPPQNESDTNPHDRNRNSGVKALAPGTG